MIRKIKKEIGKRWFIVYTQNIMSPQDFEKFKEAIGDPSKVKWYVFPSEWVKKVELIGPWRLVDYIQAIVNKIKRWLYR